MLEMEIHKSLAEEIVDELMYRLKKEADEPETTVGKLPEEKRFKPDIKKPFSYSMEELHKKFGTHSVGELFCSRD